MKKYENPTVLIMTVENEDVLTITSGQDNDATISWGDGFPSSRS